MYEVKVHTVPPRILAAVGRLISKGYSHCI